MWDWPVIESLTFLTFVFALFLQCNKMIHSELYFGVVFILGFVVSI